MMRIKNSIKNMSASIAANFITILAGLLSQAIFLRTLGSEYLGLNSLFNNIMSMLAVAEMGIGNAIIYNLYQPIANKEYDKINSLMIFYKKCYRIIGIIITSLGLLLIPFLPLIVGKITIDINITLVYLLFLANIVFSYFLSYKRSILYANQKNYYISIINLLYIIGLNLLQIDVLIITKNLYLYLIVKIIMRILENVAINYVANKNFPYLKAKNIQKIDKNVENDIFKKVKALFLHKVGAFIVLSTDNIIISKFLGLVVVGLYSNYYMIIKAISKVFGQVLNATTASIGNLLVTESKEKQITVFNRIKFLNFWIVAFTGISMLVIMQDFIVIWVGRQYLLSTFVLIILIFNYYFTCMQVTYNNFKEAAGIFYEDRIVPVVEAILNIIFSILFVKIFGLAGVFMGTIVSSLTLWCYSYPKYIYKKLFNGNFLNYIKENVIYFIIFIIIGTFTYTISKMITANSIFVKFIIDCFISLIVPNAILFLIYRKSEEFNYYYKLLMKFKNSIFKNKGEKF